MRTGITAMAVIMLLMPAALRAQEKTGVELKSISEVEIVTKTADGKQATRRVDASTAKVVPGDTVIFTTQYRNNGKQPAANVVIKNPLPANTIYVDKSASGAGTVIDFSVDNGKTFASADKLSIRTPQGTLRRATAADYTHIRWTVTKPVLPGAEGRVSFRARIK